MFRYLAATVLALAVWRGIEATPAHAEPVTVEVSIYVSDILKYDPTAGFTVDAYLGFICDQPCGDLKLIVYNGKASGRQDLVNEPGAQIYRTELALTEAVDPRPYPFDEHRLSVILVSARDPAEIRFVLDKEGSGIGTIKLQGWQVDTHWDAATDVFVDPQVAEAHLPTYMFGVNVRRPFLAGFFKTILPALAILIVGSFGLIIGPEERIKRFDLFNAAFLGTVLFQLSVLSSLPTLGYLTFADRFLLINLISIILGVGSSVWIILDYRAGNKARAWRVHAWLLTIVPLVWLSLQSLNVATM